MFEVSDGQNFLLRFAQSVFINLSYAVEAGKETDFGLQDGGISHMFELWEHFQQPFLARIQLQCTLFQHRDKNLRSKTCEIFYRSLLVFLHDAFGNEFCKNVVRMPALESRLFGYHTGRLGTQLQQSQIDSGLDFTEAKTLQRRFCCGIIRSHVVMKW